MYINKYIIIFFILISVVYNKKSISMINKNKLYIENKLLIKNHDHHNNQIIIKSDKVEGSYSNYLMFSGKVNINQNNNFIFSDKVCIYHNPILDNKNYLETIDAIGNVYYYNYSSKIILTASKASINILTKVSNFWNGKYQLTNKQFYGFAKQICLRNNNRYLILNKGYFTSCKIGDNSWKILGAKIIHDRAKKIIKIWHARFYLANIPIFYIPYFKFPIDNSNSSNFLFPNIKYSSNNGIELMIPYYWNISNIAKATIIPHYINKYGLIWKNTLKLKTQFSNDLIFFDYLMTNKKIKNHWLLHWKHINTYKKHWSLNANITQNSDNLYCNNSIFNYDNVKIDYVTNKIKLNFLDKNLNFSISLQDFNDNLKKFKYFIYPQIDINFFSKKFGFLSGSFNAQLINFKNLDNFYPSVLRMHIEPTVNLYLSNRFIRTNFKSKIFLTHYHQKNINNYNNFTSNNHLNSYVNRIIPLFKIDSYMSLHKQLKSTQKFFQILEPHIQYLYIPYRNQNNIYSHDSSLLLNDYLGLFRYQTYTGIDRIASANKITLGITTYIYDNNFSEIFYFALGQMYSFNVDLNPIKLNKTHKLNNIILVNDTYWKINKNLDFRNNIIYDYNIGNIMQNNIFLEYSLNKKYKIQINYKYNNFKYIEYILHNTNQINPNIIYNHSLYQIGEISHINIFNHLFVVNSYFYDIKNHKNINQLIGLEYRNCCYSIFFGYERKINFWKKNFYKYNNKFTLNIELSGLTNKKNINKIGNLIKKALIPYQNVF